jgi:hypothetical protein
MFMLFSNNCLQPSNTVIIFMIYYQAHICTAPFDIDRSCTEPQNRGTWCAPESVADPEKAGPDKLQTTEQQLDRLERTLRLMLARGFRLVVMHPVPESGGSQEEIMKKRRNQRNNMKYIHYSGVQSPRCGPTRPHCCRASHDHLTDPYSCITL